MRPVSRHHTLGRETNPLTTNQAIHRSSAAVPPPPPPLSFEEKNLTASAGRVTVATSVRGVGVCLTLSVVWSEISKAPLSTSLYVVPPDPLLSPGASCSAGVLSSFSAGAEAGDGDSPSTAFLGSAAAAADRGAAPLSSVTAEVGGRFALDLISFPVAL